MSNKKQIVIWVLAFLPTVVVLLCYSTLPDQIPTHWGIHGEVTYGAKNTIWLMAGMGPLFAFMFPILAKIDPRKQNYDRFAGSYQFFQIILMVFLTMVTGIVLVESYYPHTVEVGIVVTLLVGLLFVLLGNMMPKFRPNYFCGIKTPWTLASEVVWTRTHRLGGKLLFAVGILMALSVFLPETVRFYLMMVSVMTAVLVPSAMSYFWYQAEIKHHQQ